MASAAYVRLARHLTARHRHDLLLPLASARAGIARAVRLVGVARAHADAAAVRRLEIEAMRQRSEFEHALFHAIEAISEMDDGGGLVGALLGDGDVLLADILVDGG